MKGSDPERSLGFLLHDVSRLLRKRFDRRARTIGLTRSQWFVMAHLARNEGTNQSTLADILEVEPITLVHQLDRLESAGWIERRHDPDDRRVRLLHLTDLGQAILGKMQQMGLETRFEAVTGLAAAEQDALIDTLTRIKANLSARESASQASEAEEDDIAASRTRARRQRKALVQS